MTAPIPEEEPQGDRRLQEPDPDSVDDDPVAAREAARAAAEAGSIGGRVSTEVDENGEPIDEASRPVVEAGEGESEGFELAEDDLIEHATHGDQHAARRVIEDAPDEDADARAARGGEADQEEPADLE